MHGRGVAMTEEDRVTVTDCIHWATEQLDQAEVFFGHGTDNALDEAAYLVLYALHLPPEVPPEVMSTVLSTAEKRAIGKLVSQRIEACRPAAYLTGEAWFCGLKFYVDERVLIPRSPIAELIEAGFVPWLPAGRPVQRLLDIGTGSGCIAIACAYAFPGARIDAVDLSPEALKVAAMNVEGHGMQSRVFLRQSDLFSALAGQRYDLIVSNPPYVSHAEMARLPAEYRHEPATGLAAEDQGLQLVLGILQQAAEHLHEKGVLVVEVGNSRAALEARLPEVPFVWLSFTHGGEGVFLLTARELQRHQADFFR